MKYLPTLVVAALSFLGWAGGIWLMSSPSWIANAVGVLATAQALVWSAYLIHDCIHNAVFESAAANDRLGAALSWINGSCIARYEGLKQKHLRHHADRLDVVTFDYRAVLARAPAFLRRLVLALEWLYVPAVELLMRGLMIAATRPRRRVVAIIAVRVAFFAGLAVVSPKAMLLYILASLLFMQVLRFMDAYQHTFDVYRSPSLVPAPPELRRDRRYEYENTYSNLVSERLPWLNFVTLNFAYHNAHHERPRIPWNQLPTLHRTLYGAEEKQVIPCRSLLAPYHKHRVARVLAKDYGTVAEEGDRAGNFLGAVGVSFLTSV